MYKLEINRLFDASHQLPDTEHLLTKACANYHGHTYYAKVVFESHKNNRGGMVVDFKGIKEIIDELDHQFINDIFEEYYDEFVPSTAENIAHYLYHRIQEKYPDLENLRVGICEGYKGRENSSWSWYWQSRERYQPMTIGELKEEDKVILDKIKNEES